MTLFQSEMVGCSTSSWSLDSVKTMTDKLESMRGKLPFNWDSYGASPVEDKAIDAAIKVARLIEPLGLTRVEPTNDGGICISDGDESVWVTVVVQDRSDDTQANSVTQNGWDGDLKPERITQFQYQLACDEIKERDARITSLQKQIRDIELAQRNMAGVRMIEIQSRNDKNSALAQKYDLALKELVEQGLQIADLNHDLEYQTGLANALRNRVHELESQVTQLTTGQD